MVRIWKPVILLLVLLVTSVAFAAGEKEKAATDEALAWLPVVDAGKYDQSWDRAASIFKAAVTRDGWRAALGQARTPLGHVKSRKLKSATFTTQAPGAPAGEYVVIQFETSFDNLPAGIETITPAHEADGKWRVAGYFIKPAP